MLGAAGQIGNEQGSKEYAKEGFPGGVQTMWIMFEMVHTSNNNILIFIRLYG
jgi:hypothetical protein